MLFPDPSFLFFFLPILLGTYFLAPSGWRNLLLTAASLLFYALGEWRFLPLLLLSIGINYFFAIWIENARLVHRKRIFLAFGIASDLALLVVFKYAGWLVANFDELARFVHVRTFAVPTISLPLGMSFFTFHKISYKIDVFRGVTGAQRNLVTLALYILFFPQLIAGPI